MSVFDMLRGLFGGRSGNGVREIPCHEALRVVNEYLDRELEGVSAAEVAAHFDKCERCYPHLRFEQSFRRAVRRAASRETAPPELRARLERLVAEAGGDA